MTLTLSRRSLLATGTLGLGALALPGFAAAQSVLAARGFTHSVASGEPAGDSMLLWTRYVPAGGDSARLVAEISDTADFARVIASGAFVTGAWRDWTAKVTLDGLTPGTDYHYRFVAADGTRSPVGRTRTLPGNGARDFTAAIFSCSNLGFGWFNAYGHAAARDDLDLVIHLGDYFYEYSPGNYPPKAAQVPGRVPQPLAETIHLADYRLRYASYRADPDLQALHARVPWVVQWDDHESANDSWEGGAENHDPATEGDWNQRRAASVQAYREWMPVSEEPWKAYDIGTLATLWRTETRLFARSRQNEIATLLRAPDPAAALKAFRDGAWQDPAVTMMGSQQEVWLAHDLRRSVKQGQRWQVVGFGTIMGRQQLPVAAEALLGGGTGHVDDYVRGAIAATRAGVASNLDSWGGYPAARARFLRSAQAAEAELVVLSGDSHNAWAFDLAQDGPAGVEFAGQAVTSPGFESAFATDPARVARMMVEGNPELRWCDTSRRGYMALTITPEQVRNDWLFVDTIRQRTPRASVGHSATVRRGRRVMA
ncbi:alkaline phosphatase D family protein [Sphingomonas yunnanensis]|uniref:alkaline phosphatase D family protein n=1 Tax=Sphingomonas yunnanensis TaxID=310400 RepID=UPI001CA5FA45|nr:alkaline phosphatase D family protein [Sphingomonas yunnanensis]MBY9064298.1 alkaline phosphatase D family protein [Sphingomonas yunnanensis]